MSDNALVEQRGTQCWVIAGAPPDEDPHFGTRQAALTFVDDDGEPAEIVLLAEPCWVATCNTCGDIGDSDNFTEVHFDGHPEAELAHAVAAARTAVDAALANTNGYEQWTAVAQEADDTSGWEASDV